MLSGHLRLNSWKHLMESFDSLTVMQIKQILQDEAILWFTVGAAVITEHLTEGREHRTGILILSSVNTRIE